MSCGIYKWEHNDNHKIYIGKSVDIERREKQYLFMNFNSQKKFYNAVVKDGWDKFTFSIVEICRPEELDEKEKYYIKINNSIENGYNILQGGEGSCKYNYEEIYNYYMIFKSMKKTCKKFNCNYKVVEYALSCYNVSKEEIRRNADTYRCCKQIYMIDIKTKNIIKKFNSIKEASIFLGNEEYQSGISACCKNKQKTAYNYIWSFVDSYDKKIKSIKKLSVYMLDKDTNNIIIEFDTIADASRYLGNVNKNSAIRRACKLHTVSYGYKWCFAENYEKSKN